MTLDYGKVLLLSVGLLLSEACKPAAPAASTSTTKEAPVTGATFGRPGWQVTQVNSGYASKETGNTRFVAYDPQSGKWAAYEVPKGAEPGNYSDYQGMYKGPDGKPFGDSQLSEGKLSPVMLHALSNNPAGVDVPDLRQDETGRYLPGQRGREVPSMVIKDDGGNRVTYNMENWTPDSYRDASTGRVYNYDAGTNQWLAPGVMAVSNVMDPSTGRYGYGYQQTNDDGTTTVIPQSQASANIYAASFAPSTFFGFEQPAQNGQQSDVPTYTGDITGQDELSKLNGMSGDDTNQDNGDGSQPYYYDDD